jgi:putative heme-binding domain-containing protein
MNRVLTTTALLICVGLLPAQAQRAAPPAGPANPYWGKTDAIGQGEAIYNQSCTTCHGFNGEAGEIGPAIVLNMQSSLKNELSENQILDVIRNGGPGNLMPAWTGKLSDDDILKIGAYIHSLKGTAIDNPAPGDVAQGEDIFWGKGQCGTCHAIKGKGALIGPDLSNIAGKRKTKAIIEALTKEQHRIYSDGGAHLRALPVMDTYDPVRLTLTNGKTLEGVLLNQDGYAVQMMGTDNQLHLLERSQIRKIDTKTALMPTDYDKRLARDEFTDLIAFLTRQGRKATLTATGPVGN